MTPDGAQLLLFRGRRGDDHLQAPTRCEPRESVVRKVEHTPFPRARAGPGPAVGFTRDLSSSGMCLGVDRPASVGALLRAVVHAVDGRPAFDTIARVTRCERDVHGRFWLGLAFVARTTPGPRFVRPGLRPIAAPSPGGQQAVA